MSLNLKVPEEPATAEFHYEEQLQVALLAIKGFFAITAGVDFDEIIARMDRADAIGPYRDPTLWMTARQGLESQRRTMIAARDFKAALLHQLADETSRTNGAGHVV
ncbi:MAG: hypothetical protein ACREEN_01660 [Stellaceae bacterium]